MSRLKQKCIIATVGAHLLLLLTLVVGPAFFAPKPKPDNTQVLEFVPANLIDAEVSSGVKNAVPPAPKPAAQRPPSQPVQPTPPPPKVVEPTPSILSRLEKLLKPAPAKPVTNPVDQTHKVQPNLKPIVRTGVKPVPNPAVQKAIKNLQKNLNKGTEINLPGNSSVAYASYASAVRTVFDQAWVLPNTVAKDENITVSVTIASDGTVISSKIVTPSGDGPADDSVQKALDRVTTLPPFPEGTTDKERTYTIVFNPQVKSSE